MTRRKPITPGPIGSDVDLEEEGFGYPTRRSRLTDVRATEPAEGTLARRRGRRVVTGEESSTPSPLEAKASSAGSYLPLHAHVPLFTGSPIHLAGETRCLGGAQAIAEGAHSGRATTARSAGSRLLKKAARADCRAARWHSYTPR